MLVASPAAAPSVVRVMSASEMDGAATGLKADVENKVTAGGPALDEHLDELIGSDGGEEAGHLLTPKTEADEIVIGDADDDATPNNFNGDLVVQDDILGVEVQSEGNAAGDEQALVDSIHTVL